MNGRVRVDATVRRATQADAEQWREMRCDLWPESPDDHPAEIAQYLAVPPESAVCLVAELGDGGELGGFVEAQLRSYAEGCRSSPVGYLEGIYVRPDLRRSRLGAQLVAAAEAWARGLGCSEMASDRALDNESSGAFHEALGYEEVDRIVCLRKAL